jgi:hypothetical protein
VLPRLSCEHAREIGDGFAQFAIFHVEGIDQSATGCRKRKLGELKRFDVLLLGLGYLVVKISNADIKNVS